jgi:hypothetical protein
MTDTETQDPTTDPQPEPEPQPKPAVQKWCFSGSGKPSKSKWAPGGDATYLSRLRRAHLADETVPDPWFIQENGGVEDDNVPDDGWPQMAALDVATRLDEERPGSDSHWVHVLERSANAQADKDAAKAERQATQAAKRAEREAAKTKATERVQPGQRVATQEGERGEVIKNIDPERSLVKFEDGDERLVADASLDVIVADAGDSATLDQVEAQAVKRTRRGRKTAEAPPTEENLADSERAL